MFFAAAQVPVLAHSDASRQRNTSAAFGAKRTWSARFLDNNLHFLDSQRSVTELIQLFQLAPYVRHSDIYLAPGGVHGTKIKTS